MLDRVRSRLLVVDVQERLLPAFAEPGPMLRGCATLIEGAGLLGVPVTISEQYPQGLGPTVAALAAPGAARFAKTSFSCMGDPALAVNLAEDQILLCGIEAHVCVLQTALALREAGRDVFVAEDAVDSRFASDKAAALRRMAAAGVIIVTFEMALFEWTGAAGTGPFRAISALVKAR